MADVPDGRQRIWRWVVAALALLPHALPMSWVVSAALSGSDEVRSGIPLVALIEVPIAVIVFAVAGDFRGRRGWVRTVLRVTAVLGLVVVLGTALLVSTG